MTERGSVIGLQTQGHSASSSFDHELFGWGWEWGGGGGSRRFNILHITVPGNTLTTITWVTKGWLRSYEMQSLDD